MTKIIEIKNCFECPNHSWARCVKTENKTPIGITGKIPRWCPLPDKEERK